MNLRTLIQSRGVQILARYLGAVLIARLGYSAAEAGVTAQVLAEATLAVAFFAADHYIHGRRKGGVRGFLREMFPGAADSPAASDAGADPNTKG